MTAPILVSGTVAISGIIGPALAMLFYRIDGLFLIFIISGVTYFIAASLEMTIKVQKKYQIKDNSNEGITSLNWWEYIRHYKLIFQLLLVFFFMSLFLVPLQLYIPIYSKFVFHGNFQTLSLMEISLGIGTLLATLLLSIFQWNRSLWFQVFIAYLVMSLAYLLFAVNSISSLAFICLFVLGFSSGIGNIIILNVFQRYPNQKDVPGIMVCVNFTSIASAPFGLLMAGIFLNLHEIHFQVTIYALITILLALVIAILPEFKHFPKRSIRNEQAVI